MNQQAGSEKYSLLKSEPPVHPTQQFFSHGRLFSWVVPALSSEERVLLKDLQWRDSNQRPLGHESINLPTEVLELFYLYNTVKPV